MKRNIFKEETVVWSCQYHVVWCPKYRRKVLTGKIKERLEELIKEKQQEYMYNVLEMEIMPDHVHLLIEVSPKVGVYRVITKIKGYTSNVLRSEFKELRSRLPTLWRNTGPYRCLGWDFHNPPGSPCRTKLCFHRYGKP